MPLSQERSEDEPEALLPFIERRVNEAVVSGELKQGAKLPPTTVAAVSACRIPRCGKR